MPSIQIGIQQTILKRVFAPTETKCNIKLSAKLPLCAFQQIRENNQIFNSNIHETSATSTAHSSFQQQTNKGQLNDTAHRSFNNNVMLMERDTDKALASDAAAKMHVLSSCIT